jgi:hypothetical protein
MSGKLAISIRLKQLPDLWKPIAQISTDTLYLNSCGMNCRYPSRSTGLAMLMGFGPRSQTDSTGPPRHRRVWTGTVSIETVNSQNLLYALHSSAVFTGGLPSKRHLLDFECHTFFLRRPKG